MNTRTTPFQFDPSPDPAADIARMRRARDNARHIAAFYPNLTPADVLRMAQDDAPGYDILEHFWMTHCEFWQNGSSRIERQGTFPPLRGLLRPVLQLLGGWGMLYAAFRSPASADPLADTLADVLFFLAGAGLLWLGACGVGKWLGGRGR